MNWTDAVACMACGEAVRRASEKKYDRIGHTDGVPIFDTGCEPVTLVAAWTVDDKPVYVYRGLHSRELFMPEDHDRAATDWETYEK